MINVFVAEFDLLRISVAQNNKLVTLHYYVFEDVVGARRCFDGRNGCHGLPRGIGRNITYFVSIFCLFSQSG